MRLLAFDIETAEKAPANEHQSYRIGVTCAVSIIDGEPAKLWHGPLESGRYADRMTPLKCAEFAQYLVESAHCGHTVCSINGLGFDFRVLAEESQDMITWLNLRELALNHVDPGFQMLCQRGFMVGLSAMANGFGIGGKIEGMDGLRAIEMWQGDKTDQDVVLSYVEQDARVTLEICRKILETGRIQWVSKKGYANSEPVADLMMVKESLALPEPVTTFSRPWSRAKFAGWTGYGTDERS